MNKKKSKNKKKKMIIKITIILFNVCYETRKKSKFFMKLVKNKRSNFKKIIDFIYFSNLPFLLINFMIIFDKYICIRNIINNYCCWYQTWCIKIHNFFFCFF